MSAFQRTQLKLRGPASGQEVVCIFEVKVDGNQQLHPRCDDLAFDGISNFLLHERAILRKQWIILVEHPAEHGLHFSRSTQGHGRVSPETKGTSVLWRVKVDCIAYTVFFRLL